MATDGHGELQRQRGTIATATAGTTARATAGTTARATAGTTARATAGTTATATAGRLQPQRQGTTAAAIRAKKEPPGSAGGRYRCAVLAAARPPLARRPES